MYQTAPRSTGKVIIVEEREDSQERKADAYEIN